MNFTNEKPESISFIDSNDKLVQTINFSEVVVPKFVESRSGNWVLNGNNHEYVKFLLSLPSKSSIFNAIIQGKSKMIAGEGFSINDENSNSDSVLKSKVEEWFKKINSKGESADEILNKISCDLTRLGYCFIKVIWSNDKSRIEVSHLDASKIAMGKMGEEGINGILFFK